MSNKGNSRQVEIRTSTTSGPNRVTMTKTTTYTTKTTVTLDGPMAARAIKSGNYACIKGSGGGGGYSNNGGYGGNGGRGGGRGGGRRW